MTHAIKWNRRQLLQSSGALLTTSALGATSTLGNEPTAPPSERIAIGIVGLGSRGFNLIDDLARHKKGIQIAMICDVDELHYRDKPWGKGTAFGRTPAKAYIEKNFPGTKGLKVTSDFRELCAHDQIDAVVIATPDHWHALCTLEALKNGKDVYCEKPVTHTFSEGQRIYREVAKRKAVFQTGSQQRSDPEFRRAVELVRNGLLGKITRIEVGLPPGYSEPQGDATVTSPPAGLDYEFWCGPAPKLPYMQARHHRWWRGNRAFGGGVLMDWIGHHNDIAHWALDVEGSGPIRVEAVGWTFPEADIYDTPHQYEIRCEYDGGIQSSISSKHPIGTKIIGEDGWLFVSRQKLQASDARWTRKEFQAGPKTVYSSHDHMGNFLNCIHSRQACIAPAETAHRSITPGHLGYVSQALSQPLRWDPQAEKFVDNERANELLMRSEYRAPWDKF